MTTLVPGAPLAGEKLEIVGVTRNITLLESVPPLVTTCIVVVAPAGTVVAMSEPDTLVNVALVPLKVTLVVPVRLFPRIVTGLPTLPEVGTALTNGCKPTSRL